MLVTCGVANVVAVVDDVDDDVSESWSLLWCGVEDDGGDCIGCICGDAIMDPCLEPINEGLLAEEYCLFDDCPPLHVPNCCL